VRSLKQRLITESALIAGLAAWFLMSGRVPAYVLPDPLAVAGAAWDLLTDPALAVHTLASALRVVTALAAAMAAGTVLVLAAYYVPALRGLVNERLTPFFNAFPTLGWAILAVLWFGITDTGVIFVQAAILLPFVLITLWEGVSNLDAEMVEMARSFTRSEVRVLGKVIAPMLLPYAFAAMRMSYGVSWKIALIAEIFGTNRGLGYLMTLARSNFDSRMLFAAVLVVIVLVFAGDRFVFAPIQRRLTAWRAA